LFQVNRWPACSYFVLMESSRRFQPALDPDRGEFRMLDRPRRQRRGVGMAVLPRRFTAPQRRRQQAHLGGSAPDRQGLPFSRIPEFIIQRRSFLSGWRADHAGVRTFPYPIVALGNAHIRAHWLEISQYQTFPSIPFDGASPLSQVPGRPRLKALRARRTSISSSRTP